MGRYIEDEKERYKLKKRKEKKCGRRQIALLVLKENCYK